MKFGKKQLAAVVLSVLAALSLCACAGDKEDTAPAEPSTEPVSEPIPDYTGNLRISELMVKNDASLLSPDGRFSDWVEIENTSGAQLLLDGSLPTAESTEYTAPIELDSTRVIRAISVEDGALPSRPATYSYIINENHTLPVLSLAVDSPSSFSNVYYKGWKSQKLGANLALYDGESSFNHDCALSMKGWTSLSLPKKSMGVSFKGVYGGRP